MVKYGFINPNLRDDDLKDAISSGDGVTHGIKVLLSKLID